MTVLGVSFFWWFTDAHSPTKHTHTHTQYPTSTFLSLKHSRPCLSSELTTILDVVQDLSLGIEWTTFSFAEAQLGAL